MAGMDYDRLEEHSKEVDSARKELFGFGGDKANESFFDRFHKNEVNIGLKQVSLCALSVPLQYAALFMDTVYKDFMGNAPAEKLRIVHLTNFAYCLKTHQNKFFGEGEDYNENRSCFVKGALEFSVMDSLFGNDFGAAIGNYAFLIESVDSKKLDFYRQKVLRARELNGNFVLSLCQGLVAVLQNLSLPHAQVFTSEAFELLKCDEFSTPGLSEASVYITLSTYSLTKRFSELIESQ